LVPFSGAGSEAIGAALAGWDEVVGIELDPAYVAIAESRVAHWVEAERKAA
jgi:predicted RNA methylase